MLLQRLPTNAVAISEWSNADIALTDVATGIRQTIEDFLRLPASPSQATLPANTHPAADPPEQAYEEDPLPLIVPVGQVRLPPIPPPRPINIWWKFLIVGAAILFVAIVITLSPLTRQNTRLNPGSSSTVSVTATSIR